MSTNSVIRNMCAAWEAKQTNRYQIPTGPEEYHDMLLKAEQTFASYIGTRFSLGVNSGGSAITLILEHLRMRDDVDCEIVYTNCFTFNAVPSAIVNAGMRPILVECTRGLTIDLEDLERKFKKFGGKILLLSYMRGMIPDVDKVKALCKQYEVLLVEDAAHAYGIEYKGRKIGSFGIASAMSTQSNKLINTGEGGFICTNDEDLMARSIIRAGSYEMYWKRHGEMTPSKSVVMKYIYTTPNASCRMSNVQGAMALAQFEDINKRIENLNFIHASLSNALGGAAEVIKQEDFVTTPVYDSIQVRVEGLNENQSHRLAANVRKHFKFALFATETNARYFKTWKFIENIDKLEFPKTTESLENVFDMRISHSSTKDDTLKISETILQAIKQVT